MTQTPAIVTAKVQAAKTAAQAVLDLVAAIETAERALDQARADATQAALQASQQIGWWLDEERQALDEIQNRADDALGIVGDASDDECRQVLAFSL